MPTSKKGKADRIGAPMHEVEKTAKRVRAAIRQRAKAMHVPKELQKAAAELRKLTARAVAQVEKYVHELRTDLERGAATGRSKGQRKR